MEDDQIKIPAYKGSKNFEQHNVQTANATGFGAAADDYSERGIDLNEELILNKPSTFFFRMKGDAMKGAGIFEGDVLIVDRNIEPANGKIIIAAYNGELIVRRIETKGNKTFLTTENKTFKEIDIAEAEQFATWGVVTCTIHYLEPQLFHKKLKEKKSKNKK